MKSNNEINGIIPLWKPAGMTSHDCVMKIRKMLRTKKVGHTGTLDPNVTGVLPICVGRATKVVQYLTEAGKSYEGEVTIGFSTTTEDADGEIVERKPLEAAITKEKIIHVLEELTGDITQIPPMFSAVKVNGKRLYEYARQGLTVERPERKVTIYQLELLNDEQVFTGETISFSIRVKCSKGTYIRTLAVMIGEKLGYPAHMSRLVRTSSGRITSKECVTFEDLAEKIDSGTIHNVFLPIESALDSLPKYEIHDKLASKVKNGAVLEIPPELTNVNGPIAVFNNEKAIAIYKHHPTKPGLMKPERVLTVNE